MMPILLDRRGTDVHVNTEEGNIEFTLPPDESALGLLCVNKVQAGDKFGEDYWIYRDGQKVRKWFKPFEDLEHFWPPVLDDLPRLEATYWKLKQRSEHRWSYITELLKTITTTIEPQKIRGYDGWIVDGFLDKHDPKYLRRYTVHEGKAFGFDQPSYSHDRVEVPEHPLNRELGMKLEYLDETLCRGRMSFYVRKMLEEAFEKHIRKIDPDVYTRKPVHDRVYDILVNGHHYIYALQANSAGCLLPVKIAWAGSDYRVEVVTVEVKK